MDVLSAIVKIIVSTADPDKIILFGSRASGDQSPDSDYDILVLKKRVITISGHLRSSFIAS